MTETLNKALKIAVENNNMVFMEWVFTQGTPTNLCESLFLATEKGHQTAIDFLNKKMPTPIKQPRPLNVIVFDDGMAATKGTILMKDFLTDKAKFMKDLEEGVVSQDEINYQGKDGETILHYLCKNASEIADVEKYMQKIVDLGANVNANNAFDNTPLIILAKEPSTPLRVNLAKILLNKPEILINVMNKASMTAMDYTTDYFFDGKMFELLLNDSRYDVNTKDKHGTTILIYQLNQVYNETRQQIIDALMRYPKMNINDGVLMTLLKGFHSSNVPKKLEILLNHPNIDPNVVDENGQTPLMYLADKYNNTGVDQLIQMLLQHPKINKDLKNKDGLTAAMIFHQKCPAAKYFN